MLPPQLHRAVVFEWTSGMNEFRLMSPGRDLG